MSIRILARLFSVITALTGLWLFAPAPAGADAVFVAATPAGQATVGGVVEQIQIVFNELVTEGDIVIEGPDGPIVLLDQTRDGQVISARFAPLSVEGRYSVTYSVVSADTDSVDGSLGFNYAADGPVPLPVSVPALQTGASPLLVGLVVIGLAAVAMLAGQTFLRTQRVRKVTSSDGVPFDT